MDYYYIIYSRSIIVPQLFNFLHLEESLNPFKRGTSFIRVSRQNEQIQNNSVTISIISYFELSILTQAYYFCIVVLQFQILNVCHKPYIRLAFKFEMCIREIFSICKGSK